MCEGLVIKAIASFFYVYYEGEIYECRSSSKLKKKKVLPGDKVLFDFDKLYIKDILERENELVRPKIANVLGAVLVFSLTEPKMNYGLLDRMLMIMEYNGISPIILFTKKDLCNAELFEELNLKNQYYEDIGYKILYNNDIQNKEEFQKYLTENKYILTGQTGVGKSTFLNKMIEDANAQTNEISKALGRGKHTTRETTFYFLNESTFLIDTPGFSSLDIELNKEEIRDSFREFVDLSAGCRFNGCYHLNEPNCKVKEEVEKGTILISRYENYKKLMEDKC